jgi:hypothetical protein
MNNYPFQLSFRPLGVKLAISLEREVIVLQFVNVLRASFDLLVS